MHDQICGKHEKQEDDDEPLFASATGNSALVPRFRLMDPVPVVTGMNVKAVGAPKMPADVSGNVPIPRPRPAMPDNKASSEAEPAFDRFESAFGDAQGDQ
jgi:hypothetical protein